jgi:hypothetical protein
MIMEIRKRMRIIRMYALLIFVIASPNYTAAGWEVASPGPAGPVTPREPFFQSKIQQSAKPMQVHTYHPTTYEGPAHPHAVGPRSAPLPHVAVSPPPPNSIPERVLLDRVSLGQPRGMYAVSISGSLKENIERIMSRYHWRVIWKAPYDYNFDGRIIGKSLPNVIDKLLEPFPLHAVMYMSNKTLAVTTRPRYK